ncbi:MAG: diguanylate cyclase [Candidatus Aureabacteria bacterium]|nr:diguanylate cyclase [Candidatus Auribacterota bacterium]
MKDDTAHQDVDILIVDDDPAMLETLRDILSEESYRITCVRNATRAEEEIKRKFYNLALIDLNLPDGRGLELLRLIKIASSESVVIIFTGYASLESAVSALNEGAFAYLQKPLNMGEVKISLQRALDMQRLSFDNKKMLNRLEELSLKDARTGLYNYRYLMERLTSEVKRARRYVFPLSVLMLDLDYFKSINDVYGHQYGDRILKELADYLQDFVRAGDIVARYGGEEFVILLPDTNKRGAVIFCARLLAGMGSHTFDPRGKKIKLKISVGIANFPEDGVTTGTGPGILDMADRALFRAKESGGNRLSTCEYVRQGVKDDAQKGEMKDIEEVRKKLAKMARRANQSLLETIYALAKTIEAKDQYPGTHSEDMVFIVTEIGKRMKLTQDEIDNLKHAAILHDLGKVGIPDNILHKGGKLTVKEYELLKKHPQIGAEIIGPLHILEEVIPIILYHHERFDGLGYSAGLKGKEIPLGARITAIADVYEALVSSRPYRNAYSNEEALGIVEGGAGTQFDPEIVKLFLEIMKSRKQRYHAIQ